MFSPQPRAVVCELQGGLCDDSRGLISRDETLMIPVGGGAGNRACAAANTFTHTETVHIKDRAVANNKRVGEAHANKRLTVSTPRTINMYTEKLAEPERGLENMCKNRNAD